MGVKDLWCILDGVCEPATLQQLRGLRLAVDLGCWVCQMHTAIENPTVAKPYLRNLFFRVSALLQLDVFVICVTDGKPVDLKQQTLALRQRDRFRVSSGRAIQRRRFQAQMRECAELLKYMGVCVIDSDGEAEAICAALNAEGFVDGVLTDDSDVFLYGACCVYRHFSLNSKQEILRYRIEKIQSELRLDRDKLVALGLLLGCDYCPKGVPGVGKELALKFLHTCPYEDVLGSLVAWTESALSNELAEMKLSNSRRRLAHCAICKHSGTEHKHKKSGCEVCDDGICQANERVCTCTDCDDQRTWSLPENQLKRKLTGVDRKEFQIELVIEEFKHKQALPNNLSTWQWTRPLLGKFKSFMVKETDWPEEYCVAKLVPLITLWSQQPRVSGMKPRCIIKERTKDHEACFEVQWPKLGEDTTTAEEFYITLETVLRFSAAFPECVTAYKESKESKEVARQASKKPPKKPPLKPSPNKKKRLGHDDDDVSQQTLEEAIFRVRNVRNVTTDGVIVICEDHVVQEAASKDGSDAITLNSSLILISDDEDNLAPSGICKIAASKPLDQVFAGIVLEVSSDDDEENEKLAQFTAIRSRDASPTFSDRVRAKMQLQFDKQ